MLNKLSDFLSSIIPPASAENRPEHTLQLATAVLLTEVMQSDAECALEERATILKILKERFQLSDAEVRKLAELGQQTSKTANDFQQFTSLINRELELSEGAHHRIHVASRLCRPPDQRARKPPDAQDYRPALHSPWGLHRRQNARQACRPGIMRADTQRFPTGMKPPDIACIQWVVVCP